MLWQILVEAYGSDAVRYYFAKEVEFGRDGDFSEEHFRNIVNANLANSVGNLLNRTLGLLKKFCGGLVPGDASSLEAGHPLRSVVDEQVCRPAGLIRRTSRLLPHSRRLQLGMMTSCVCRFQLLRPNMSR